MILIVLLAAFAVIGVQGLRGMADAQTFGLGTKPLDVMERYARRATLPLLLAALAIVILDRYAPELGRPSTDHSLVLLMALVPVGVIIASFVRWVVPAMAARSAREAERLDRLLRRDLGD